MNAERLILQFVRIWIEIRYDSKHIQQNKNLGIIITKDSSVVDLENFAFTLEYPQIRFMALSG
jgi:hypothetical protein